MKTTFIFIALLVFFSVSVGMFADDDFDVLFEKVAHGDIQGLEEAIANGRNANARDEKYRSTALNMSCSYGYMDMAEILIAGGADINATAKDGSTALSLATHDGHGEMAAYLINH